METTSALQRIGRYELQGELGRGGMGIVYRAVRDDQDTPVALKVLSRGRVPDEDDRFRRELELLGSLDHPGIVRLLETGRHEGRPFYAMELVPGRSLEAEIKASGPLPWWLAARIGRDTAEALAYLHEAGIIHRDVKPANILLTPDGSTRLIDFGLARRPHDQAVTTTSWVVGTPLYMAPETFGLEPGPAGDVFALGVTLWESLAGAHPFREDALTNPLGVLTKFARGAVPLIGDRAPTTPDPLARVVNQCLLPDATARPTALELAWTLERLGVHERDASPGP